MEKTTKSEKYLRVSIVLLSLILALSVGIGTYFFKDRYDLKKQTSQQQKESVKWLAYHMRNTYELLRDNAYWYNKHYARLTLNHTRDTVVHPRYTVAEFYKLHDGLIRTMNVFDRDVENKNRFYGYQLQDILPVSYQFQQVFGTFRVRDDLYTKLEVLEDAFTDIANHTPLTDSVPNYTSYRTPRFNRYFKVLEEIDKAYYELLAYRYPDDLAFLTKMYPEFIAAAKDRMFAEQRFELINTHYELKHNIDLNSPFYRLSEKAGRCETFGIDSLTTYMLQTNNQAQLLMVQTEKSLSNLPPKEQLQFLEDMLGCARADLKTMRAPLVYIICQNGNEFFTDDSYRALQPLENGDKEKLLSFYNDGLGNYYIKGSYDPYNLFFPKKERLEH